MEDRTTATKSGPGKSRAGMKKAKTLIRTTAWSMPPRLGLLDRRDNPLAAVAAQEGPDFRRFRAYLGVALDDRAVGQAAGVVDQAEAHGDRGVVDARLAPGFGQVALFELHRLDLVLEAAAGIGRHLLGEVTQHIGPRARAHL